MKLTEKHVGFLDAMPLNEWMSFWGLPSRVGITGASLRAFSRMGLVEMCFIGWDHAICDSDVSRGFVKARISKEPFMGGTPYYKKIVNDYRTKDYEIFCLEKTIANLQEDIKRLKGESVNGTNNSSTYEVAVE